MRNSCNLYLWLCSLNLRRGFLIRRAILVWYRHNGKLWFTSDINHLLNFNMQMVNVFREKYTICMVKVEHHKGYSPSNSTPGRFPSYFLLTVLLYFRFIFKLTRYILPDFPSVSSLASLPYLSCHQTTTTTTH